MTERLTSKRANDMDEKNGAILWPGIVTVSNWTAAPDGETYLQFWAQRWRIFGDRDAGEAVGLERLKSADGFFLVGYDGESPDPAIIIPGCSFKGFARLEHPIDKRSVFNFGATSGAAP